MKQRFAIHSDAMEKNALHCKNMKCCIAKVSGTQSLELDALAIEETFLPISL